MYLQCTKKMLDKMNMERFKMLPADDCDDGADGFYSWHVNLITLNRRKAIVCMNNLTRYPIVLYRPKTRDMSLPCRMIHLKRKNILLCMPDR